MARQGHVNSCVHPHHRVEVPEGTAAGRAPASTSMFRPSIPLLYPCHTDLGVPFSQLQKHKSFIHDWKKWWRGIVMTILTSLGIFACSLGQ